MKTHQYPVNVAWTGNLGSGTSSYEAYSRDHLVRVAGTEAIAGSSDPAFLGDPARHNPEQLFVASISACHMLWYLHLCATNEIVVTDYADDALGSMREQPRGPGRFVDVLLRPKVVIAPGGDPNVARRLHETAHDHCFIANSLNIPVHCEPTITVATV